MAHSTTFTVEKSSRHLHWKPRGLRYDHPPHPPRQSTVGRGYLSFPTTLVPLSPTLNFNLFNASVAPGGLFLELFLESEIDRTISLILPRPYCADISLFFPRRPRVVISTASTTDTQSRIPIIPSFQQLSVRLSSIYNVQA